MLSFFPCAVIFDSANESSMKNPLDYIKIRTKLIVIYLLTVFIAMGSLTSFYVVVISKDTRELAYGTMLLQAQSCAESVSELVNGAFQVTENIEVNDEIRRFLSEGRQDEESYRSVIKNINGILTVYSKYIDDISLYSDVPTYSIVGTINYVRQIEELGKYDWGASFFAGGKNIILTQYADVLGKTRLSLVRYCFSDTDGMRCVLKTDLNLTTIRNVFVKGISDNHTTELSLILGENRIATAGRVNEKKTILCDEVPMGTNILLRDLKVKIRAEADDIYGTAKTRTWQAILFSVIIMAIAGIVILFVAKSVIVRLQILRSYMAKATVGNYDCIEGEYGKDEIGESIESYNFMVRTINSLFKDIYSKELSEAKLQREIVTARYMALKAQIDPHYFYNVLNSIRAKCIQKGEMETAQIILSLAGLFRNVVDWKDDLIAIESELDCIERYMRIQKYRFSDNFDYTVECDEALMRARIPKMTILTLAENACKHGIENNGGYGTVRIRIYKENGKVCISVFDNGKALAAADLERIDRIMTAGENMEDAKGLNNIYNRLHMYYKNKVQIEIVPQDGVGNTFVIKIDEDGCIG